MERGKKKEANTLSIDMSEYTTWIKTKTILNSARCWLNDRKEEVEEGEGESVVFDYDDTLLLLSPLPYLLSLFLFFSNTLLF